jgi:hypothetical protein
MTGAALNRQLALRLANAGLGMPLSFLAQGPRSSPLVEAWLWTMTVATS